MSRHSLQDVIDELDSRLRRFEALADADVREEVFTILQLVDTLHRTGLDVLAERLEGTAAWDGLVEEDAVRVLLTLYDFLPAESSEADVAATAPIGPRPESTGRGAEASSKNVWIELPMTVAGERPRSRAPVFREIAAIGDIPTDRAVVVDGEHQPLLLVRISDDAYAYDPTCPGCGLSLDGAKVTAGVLLCPWRNCAFDAGSGRRADGEQGQNLRAIPVRIQHRKVLLASVPASANRVGDPT